MSELDKKNAAAVHQTIRRMEERLLAQDTKILSLQTLVQTLIGRLDNAEQRLALQRIASLGTGATVK